MSACLPTCSRLRTERLERSLFDSIACSTLIVRAARHASAETDEAMETGGGLASLGRHSDAGARKDPAWKHALRSLILYVASLLCLLVLDAIWMKGLAPVLGVDYFAIVKVSVACLILIILCCCMSVT